MGFEGFEGLEGGEGVGDGVGVFAAEGLEVDACLPTALQQVAQGQVVALAHRLEELASAFSFLVRRTHRGE